MLPLSKLSHKAGTFSPCLSVVPAVWTVNAGKHSNIASSAAEPHIIPCYAAILAHILNPVQPLFTHRLGVSLISLNEPLAMSKFPQLWHIMCNLYIVPCVMYKQITACNVSLPFGFISI